MNINKILKELLPYVIILVVVILLRTFIINPVEVSGDSMLPTLKEGEILLLDKISYHFSKISRFDIVVIETTKKPIIKRIIGLPGEHVRYENNVLYINGEVIEDKYFEDHTNNFTLEILGYDIIPEGKYLVLGDNRDKSSDSRSIGLIDRKDISGKTSFRIWPFNKVGSIKK